MDSMDAPKRLWKYLAVYKARLAMAIVLGALMSGCTVLVSLFVRWFVTAGNDAASVKDIWPVAVGLERGWIRPDGATWALMWIVAIGIVCAHVLKGIFQYFNAYLVASVTNRVGTDVRADMYSHIQSLPLSFFHKSKIGDLMSRMSYDVGLIQNSSNIVTQAVDGPLLIIAGLTMMFILDWKLSLLTVIFVPMMAIAIDKLAKKLRPLTVVQQATFADAAAVMEESIRGVRIVKSFNMEDQEVKRFGRANTNSLIAALRAARRSALVSPLVELMGAAAASLIIMIGGLMMVRGELTFPDLTQFTVLAFSVAAAFKSFGRLNVMYQQTMAGAERIFELLDTKSDLPDAPNAVVLKDVRGLVEFDNVRFEYNAGEPVLEDLSFKIDQGEIVAIVGPSGAGKSTIADLIPRFYDVTGGRVMVEGYDVREVQTRSLRECIAMVPQETILFSGTIADNISYGRPGADFSEIIEAAKAANAHEFIEQMPMGYETVLGEGGVGLSGGQRQRIAIARALLKDPKILILDEATSSLDAASEGIVQEALDRLMRGRSTLIIAHRLSTVTGAHRILVMEKGRVVEQGSFEQLVAGGGLFSQLYRTQFRAEETV